MTEKEMSFIEALCDAFNIDYPEEYTEESYEKKLNSYDFTSGCTINGTWMTLKTIVDTARNCGILEDEDF